MQIFLGTIHHITDEILEKHSRLHCKNIIGDPTFIAIKTWGKFLWTILTPGEYLYMDPGEIHCVVSSVNSAPTLSIRRNRARDTLNQD